MQRVLLTFMKPMYGVYHGPNGIRKIGKKIHSLTSKLSEEAYTVRISSNQQNIF